MSPVHDVEKEDKTAEGTILSPSTMEQSIVSLVAITRPQLGKAPARPLIGPRSD